MKLRGRRKMIKRLEERRTTFKPGDTGFKKPGSQNPHKGRWGSSRRKLR